MAGWNCQRILVGIVVALICVVLALVGIIVWRELRFKEGDSAYKYENETIFLTEETALEYFPGFFQSSEQQQAFETFVYNGFYYMTPVTSQTIKSVNCNFSCAYPPQKFKRVVLAQQGIYHGCCFSTITFVTPDAMMDIYNRIRTFVQFDKLKQVFANETCQSVRGCTGAICSRQTAVITAVVVKIGKTKATVVSDVEIGYFLVPGCCKSVNT